MWARVARALKALPAPERCRPRATAISVLSTHLRVLYVYSKKLPRFIFILVYTRCVPALGASLSRVSVFPSRSNGPRSPIFPATLPRYVRSRAPGAVPGRVCHCAGHAPALPRRLRSPERVDTTRARTKCRGGGRRGDGGARASAVSWSAVARELFTIKNHCEP